MIDFLLENYSFLTHFFEFLAAFTGLWFYRKYKFTHTRYFILFLIVIALGDLINMYTNYVYPDKIFSFLIGTKFEKNHWWSTLYWDIGAIIFFVFYFYQILKTKLFRLIIKYSGYSFFLFSIIYLALNWNKFFVQFFTIFDVFGALIVFLCSVFYFIEILNSDKILTFYRSINFYISAAIFIWWLVITPLTFYNVYYVYDIKNSFVDRDFLFIRRQIYLFANILMYSTFTFALIWCKPEND